MTAGIRCLRQTSGNTGEDIHLLTTQMQHKGFVVVVVVFLHDWFFGSVFLSQLLLGR